MAAKKCRLCNAIVHDGQSHRCPQRQGEEIPFSDSSFLMSVAIGAATDNAVVGGLLGGDPAGGLLGDILNDGELF